MYGLYLVSQGWTLWVAARPGPGRGHNQGRETRSGIWPLTAEIDRVTWPFLKYDRATWTLAIVTLGPKRW